MFGDQKHANGAPMWRAQSAIANLQSAIALGREDRMTQRQASSWLRALTVLGVVLALLIILLPIDGHVVIFSESPAELAGWPRFSLDQSSGNEGAQRWLVVQDMQPWGHVKLMSVAGSLTRDEAWAAGNGPWRWRWHLPDDTVLQQPLVFYHSCETGCRERGRATFAADARQPEPERVATKLGVVFPSPERNWHGRAAWAVELTYVKHQDDKEFSIDGLAARVARDTAQGLKVIVRIGYARKQSLPPVDDEIALRDYLEFCHRQWPQRP
jgi:hypothetical protein